MDIANIQTIAEKIQRNINFLDKGFEESLTQERQSRLFELVVCEYINKGDLVALPSKKGGRTGPDFLLQYGDIKIWVECYKPKISLSGTDLNKYSNQIATQITGGIVGHEGKKEKYIKYMNSGIICKKDYFLLAISVGKIGDDVFEINGQAQQEFGSWAKLAFFGNDYLSILDFGKPFLQTQTPPKKNNGEYISNGFFKENNWLDGILYFSGDEEKKLLEENLNRIGFLKNPFSPKNGEILLGKIKELDEKIIFI